METSLQWAPDFVASTTRGPIAFHEWAGIDWVILLAQGKESPTWSSELGLAAQFRPELERLGAKVIGLLGAHSATPDTASTATADAVPVILDPRQGILRRLASPGWRRNHLIRPVFIIDPSKRIRLTLTYPHSAIRDVREVAGIIDSLRTRPGPGTLVLQPEERGRMYPHSLGKLQPWRGESLGSGAQSGGNVRTGTARCGETGW